MLHGETWKHRDIEAGSRPQTWTKTLINNSVFLLEPSSTSLPGCVLTATAPWCRQNERHREAVPVPKGSIQPKYKSNLLVFYIYLLFVWPAWTFNLYLNGIAPAVVLSIEFGRATGGCKLKRCSLSQKHQCVCPLSCFRERKRSKVNRTLFR